MTATFYAAQPTVNLKTLVATVEIFQHNPDAPDSPAEASFIVTEQLAEISERNIPHLISAAQAFDWSGADPTLAYHLNRARQVIASPTRPDGFHDFDFGAMVWRDRRTLADRKAAKWEEVKQWRAQAGMKPLMATRFGIFDAAVKDMDNIKDTVAGLTAAAALGTEPASIRWTMADSNLDRYVTLTPNELREVGVALLTRGNAAHERSRVLYDQIERAISLQDLAAVVWSPVE